MEGAGLKPGGVSSQLEVNRKRQLQGVFCSKVWEPQSFLPHRMHSPETVV